MAIGRVGHALLTAVDKAQQALEEEGMLEAYAANDALTVLVRSWREALKERENPNTLVNDIALTVDKLRNVQFELRRILAAEEIGTSVAKAKKDMRRIPTSSNLP